MDDLYVHTYMRMCDEIIIYKKANKEQRVAILNKTRFNLSQK